MKKAISILLTAVILLSLFTVLPQVAHASIWGDFEYDTGSDGNTKIIKYLGSDTSVTIPSRLGGHDVTVVEGFEGCDTLESVAIPNTVTAIGRHAFAGCINLKDVEIPDSVESIVRGAFANCVSLKSIHIPASVTNIGNQYSGNYEVFQGCSALEQITVDENNPVYDSRNNCNAIIETKKNTLVYGCKNTVIPDSVTAIGSSAFIGQYTMENIEVPSSVRTVGSYAFENCTMLKTITLPSVKTIGYMAFYNCSSLNDIVIGKTAKEIEYSAFAMCTALTDIYFGGTSSQWSKALVRYFDGTALTRAAVHYNSVGPGTVPVMSSSSGVTVIADVQADLGVTAYSALPSGISADGKIAKVLELTLYCEYGEELTGDATVMIPCKVPSAKVYRLEGDNSLTDMNAVFEDGNMVFTTGELGTFIVVLPKDCEENTIDDVYYIANKGDRLIYEYLIDMNGEPTEDGGIPGVISIIEGALEYNSAKLRLISDVTMDENENYAVLPEITSGYRYAKDSGRSLEYWAYELYGGYDFSTEKALLRVEFEAIDDGICYLRNTISGLGSDSVKIVENGDGIERLKVRQVVTVEPGQQTAPTEPPVIADPTEPVPTQPDPTGPASIAELGDADGNGLVNVFDASYVQKGLTGSKGYPAYASMDRSDPAYRVADADGDGTVNIFDASLIQKYVTGSSSAQGYGIGEPIG